MTTNSSGVHSHSGSGPGLMPVLVIGALIGMLFTGDILTADLSALALAFCWGSVISFLSLQWIDLTGQSLSLIANPLPLDTELADRGSLHERMARLARGPIHHRLRNLLSTWVQGWDPRTVIDLASYQSSRARRTIVSEVVFMFILVVVANVLGGLDRIAIAAIAVLGLTLAARQALNGGIDAYVESHVLARLPANLPHTSMTAAELAAALGGSIENSFKKYIPQPADMTQAIRHGIEEANLQFTGQIKTLHDALLQNQTVIVQTWANAAKTTTHELRDVEKALATVVSDLTGGLHTNAEKMQHIMTHHTQEIQKVFAEVGSQLKHNNVDGAAQLQTALKTHVDLFSQNNGAWAKQLQSVLGEHVSTLDTATKALVGQLDQIASLSKNIEQVLHVQEAVDSAVRDVATTEEFRKTLETLRKHIEESDNLLREVTKPRTIRLVETEEEILQS
ncbi:MAG TPA: hypothetical protein DCZ95_04780 [Verrucomicrobia bacterium]|nr:hypothetical protein [Verrucomicrobiota bacterium]